jgi:hypothetical protein
MLKVLEIFDFTMYWWYWQVLDMGNIVWHFWEGLVMLCFVKCHTFEWICPKQQ